MEYDLRVPDSIGEFGPFSNVSSGRTIPIGAEQDFGASLEQEDGAAHDVRACPVRRMRTMNLLGTL
jgi:hypothetical protein